ncbi:MAG TPA: zinc ribbon domain-containing protein [Ignavibacteriaceae bacterium]|nr:zinc ribbon domain-containing protein [Ignavibacteriaceae bacterium]
MPVFEYQCQECKTKFDVFHKSQNHNEEITCPNCSSHKSKKLFSTFSAAVANSGSDSYGGCSDGSCAIPNSGGCASGMCGLN